MSRLTVEWHKLLNGLFLQTCYPWAFAHYARTQFSVPCRQNINLCQYRLSQITFKRRDLACCSELFYRHLVFRTAQSCEAVYVELRTDITWNATFPKTTFFIVSLFIRQHTRWQKIIILFLFKVADFICLKSYEFLWFILSWYTKFSKMVKVEINSFTPAGPKKSRPKPAWLVKRC